MTDHLSKLPQALRDLAERRHESLKDYAAFAAEAGVFLLTSSDRTVVDALVAIQREDAAAARKPRRRRGSA